MHSPIHEIPQNKSREEHKSVLLHNEIHQSENCRSNNYAGYRRHKQALFIPWIMMMIAMKCVSEFFHSWTFANQVKNETVSDVFEQSPKKHTTQEDE